MTHFLSDIKEIRATMKSDSLVALEGADTLPLKVKRIFLVKGEPGSIRGHHAHRALTQYLTCVHGECHVTCDDGQQKKQFILNRLDRALLIPPGIWAEQYYVGKDSVLMVVCDAVYDEVDYIRDYNDFISYRSKLKECQT